EGDSARFAFSGKISNGHMDGQITDAEGNRFPFLAVKGDGVGQTEMPGGDGGPDRGAHVQRAPGPPPGSGDDRPANPQPAEQATLAVFDTHEIVGLGILSYSNQDFNNFILALIRNPGL